MDQKHTRLVMKKLFNTLLLSIAFGNIYAQRPHTGTWLSVQAPVKVNQKWQLHNDAGYRTMGNSFSGLQYLYRTGLRYQLNKQWNTAAGIAFFFTRSSFPKSNNEFAREFRFWEEINYQQNPDDHWQLVNRVRIEQRFYAATSSISGYTAYRFRFRTSLTRKITPKYSLQIADEYMRQQARNKFLFDQNRLIATIIYKLNRSSQLQAGYMWLLWPNSSQHILTLTFQRNISLHGNKD
jgi:hypothetical protein